MHRATVPGDPVTPYARAQPRNLRRQATSLYRGVSWDSRRGKWAAQITVRGVNRYLGHFTSDTEAALAYDREALRIYGPRALTNFPDPR